jgi:TPR repeat protein
MGDGHYIELRGRWIPWPECDAMTSARKIAAAVTGVAVIGAGAILWHVHKERAIERKFAEDARVCRVRAQQGDAKAQSKLASMYYYGKGVPQDYADAVRWYRKAADQGYTKAQFNLGSIYYYGKGVARDYAEAVRWYRKAAEQGDANAQYSSGLMYYRGQGVPQDDAEAVCWFRKAADQGDVAAQSYLGFSYFHGQGVPQDYTEAVRWSRKAADQGDETAQLLLASMYYHGQGVSKNYAEAARWFGKGLGKVAASCFARTQSRPLQRWTEVLGILFALPVLVVPQRRWGRASWLATALVSATLAAVLAHELLSQSSLTLLNRVLPGTILSFGRVLWLSLLAGGSAIYAIAAVVEAVRGSKRGGDQGCST